MVNKHISDKAELHPAIELLLDEVAEYDVISFDYFDTLFVRNVHDPEDVFDILGSVYGIEDFKVLRREAQAKAFVRMHETGKKEITLEGIYDCFSHPGVKSEDLAHTEMAIELSIVTPNRELIGVFNECIRLGKTVILTSDMYLPEAFFRESFRRHGLPDVPYFISAECNATKRDFGDLFDVVVAKLGVPREKILHIGDNPHGDIKQARAKGINAFQYNENRRSTRPAIYNIESSISASLYRRHPELIPPQSYVELGYLKGGAAAFGYLEWIAKECVKDQIDSLLFMSRDGYVLHQIAKQLPSIKLPPYKYFYGSRTAFTLAAIDEGNFADFLPFFLSGANGLSVCDLLARIGVPAPAQKVIDELGLPSAFSPSVREIFEIFLFAYKGEILKVCRRNRRALFIYLKQLGVLPNSRVGLVDVGWNATSQEAFELATSSLVNINLNITGYYLCLANTSDCARRRAIYRTRALVSAETHSKELVDNIYQNRVAAELIFSAPHASVIGWDVDAERNVIPITDSRGKQNSRLSQIASDISEGVSVFATNFAALINELSFCPTPENLISPLVEFVTSSDWRSNELINQLTDFDNWVIRHNAESDLA